MTAGRVLPRDPAASRGAVPAAAPATAYYNEHDPNAAAWLRELVRRGLIAPGDVDERSIEDVVPTELLGYTQCHFFAGIGGWSLAMRLAGWPDDRPVWTGSCPCQPFSAAGKGKGFADERHLWPAFFHLISVCGPERVYGEQVARKDGFAWLDLVHTDMEAVGYAFGAIPFPSAATGAPHERERTYWLADAMRQGESRWGIQRLGEGDSEGARASCERSSGFCASGLMADADNERLEGRGQPGCGRAAERLARPGGMAGWMADADGENRRPGPTNGFWRNADWLGCRDGKWRPVEPGTFPLAHGLPARVVRLRGYGNAINPWQAAEFIIASEEAVMAA